jgi:hypothetical protein
MTKAEETRFRNLTEKKQDEKLKPVELKHLKRLTLKKKTEKKPIGGDTFS